MGLLRHRTVPLAGLFFPRLWKQRGQKAAATGRPTHRAGEAHPWRALHRRQDCIPTTLAASCFPSQRPAACPHRPGLSRSQLLLPSIQLASQQLFLPQRFVSTVFEVKFGLDTYPPDLGQM